MSTGKTNIAELLGDLNAGVFQEQINTALSDIAANVCTRPGPGAAVRMKTANTALTGREPKE